MYRVAYIKINNAPILKCICPDELAIHNGDYCIFKNQGMLDFGHVEKLASINVDSSTKKNLPSILHCATLQDQAKAKENELMSRIAMDTCSERIKKYKLKIRLINARYSFDKLTLRVMFTAEKHFDFREMIKELDGELRTRVEMKQIGVRDEAAIVGGIGPCGRSLCCSTWLHNFASVNVKMAKMQELSLSPSSIAGMCGRLKCCLRYEYGQYLELNRKLPSQGSLVQSPDGQGRVIEKYILLQHVNVRLDDGRIVEYDVKELKKK